MTSFMRRTVRAAALACGALALTLGTAGCGAFGGGEENPDGQEQPAQQDDPEQADPAEDDTAEDGAEDSDAEASDGGGQESEGELSEEDLTAAEDRFHETLQLLGENDIEGACQLTIDPATGEPSTGDAIQECVDSFTQEVGEDFDPAVLSIIDRSMITAEDDGEGIAKILIAGEDSGATMQQADGEWYLKGLDSV